MSDDRKDYAEILESAVKNYEAVARRANEGLNETEKFDVISKPAHYTEGRKFEPKDVIVDWDLNFFLGNALKYISRAGRKNDAIEDLNKAKQYIDFEIERIKKEANHE